MVETLHLFYYSEGKGMEGITQIVSKTMSKLLVSDDYMTKRLDLDPKEGRLEFDCNDEGEFFTATTCELTLDQLLDINIQIWHFPNSFGIWS